MLGEKVVCAAVSLQLYMLLYIQVKCYLPLTQLPFSFRDFSCGVWHVRKIIVSENNPHMRLRTQQTFCYRHNILVRDSEMPIVTM